MVLLLGLLFVAARGSGDEGEGVVEPRTVAAERRPFTATVPLAATVDVDPASAGASYMVTARVDPLTLYRLPDQPSRATVRIIGGPPEFACAAVGLATVPAMPSANGQSSSDESGGGLSLDEESGDVTVPQAPAGRQAQAAAETVVRCSVPPEVRVFPGLRAELVITTAELPNAVVVPAGAVEPDSAQTGHVTVISGDDREERRPVKLGPSNGSMAVIAAGLAEGEKVLDRVPIKDPAAGGQGGTRVVVP